MSIGRNRPFVYPPDMRNLNEIVTRRAKEAIERAQKSANDGEGRHLSERQIAARMAEFMGANPASVQKQLRRYLAGESPWRIDYIESLGRALGLLPSELLSLDSGNLVPEATRAQFLLSSVASRLDAKQLRRLARDLNRLLDDERTYGLAVDVLEAILETDSKDSTHAEVSKVILSSRSFDSKRRSLRGKRIVDKKS